MWLWTLPSESSPIEVHRLATVADPANELLPLFAFEDLAAVDRHLDTLGALVEDSPGPERVVPDLAVAHVVVAREARRPSRALRSRVVSDMPASRSSVGVRASQTASPSFDAPHPTPSMTTMSTGPGTPAKFGCFLSCQSVTRDF